VNKIRAKSLLSKACTGLRVLDLMRKDRFYYAVTQEAKRVVELTLRLLLTLMEIESAVESDLGQLVLKHRAKLPLEVGKKAECLVSMYKSRRVETAFNIRGERVSKGIQNYNEEDAVLSIRNARFAIEVAQQSINAYDFINRD